MVVGLLIGRKGSTGFPGKNTKPILGRPLTAYPLLAAKNSKYIDKIFVSTDSDEIKLVGDKMGAEFIERPSYLATKEALSEDAFLHGYNEIKRRIGQVPEFVVLLFCNSPTITSNLLDEGIEKLRQEKSYDSAVTVSVYNMFSPLRARKIDENGDLIPFVPVDMFENASCDRDSQGDAYFADCSGFVVRPHCFDYDTYGEVPFRWIGKKVYPLKQWGGIDIDYEWQVGQAIFWLQKHGFSKESTPYEKRKNIND